MVLEELSFLTEVNNVSHRFSISGAIFLVMVELYGPMANPLSKVSMVTWVDSGTYSTSSSSSSGTRRTSWRSWCAMT